LPVWLDALIGQMDEYPGEQFWLVAGAAIWRQGLDRGMGAASQVAKEVNPCNSRGSFLQAPSSSVLGVYRLKRES
jgi:hypothetical protein